MTAMIDSDQHIKQNTNDSVEGDGFVLNFSNGRGVLSLINKRVNNLAFIKQMDMVIPKISFPFDMSQGVRGLRHHRHTLYYLSLSIDVNRLMNEVNKRLDSDSCYRYWSHSLDREGISLLLREGPEAFEHALSFKLIPYSSNGVLQFLVNSPMVFGPIERSIPETVSQAVSASFGMNLQGFILTVPDVIRWALIQVLPNMGRRLPDSSKVRLQDISILSDSMLLVFAHFGSVAHGEIYKNDPSLQSDEEAQHIEHMKMFEEMSITEEGDICLAAGRVDEGREFFANLSKNRNQNAIIASRQGMIDVLSSSTRHTAIQELKTLLDQHPKRKDILAPMLQGAALLGDRILEIDLLERIVDIGSQTEKLGAGMRLVSVLLNAENYKKAIALLDHLSREFPDDKNILRELLKAATKTKDSHRLRRLIPRWNCLHSDPSEQIEANIELGEMLLSLDDYETAAFHFEKASILDPNNINAVWGFAQSLKGMGESVKAASLFDALSQILKNKGDRKRAAEALCLSSEIWMDKGEHDLAKLRLTESLTIDPNNLKQRLKLAAVLIELHLFTEAAVEMEAALKICSLSDEKSRILTELSRLYLYELNDPATARKVARQGLISTTISHGCKEIVKQALIRQRFNESNIPSAKSTSEILEAAHDAEAAEEVELSLQILSLGCDRFPDSIELINEYIALCRRTDNMELLYNNLPERLSSAETNPMRGKIELELGQLCLRHRNNPTAALCFFKSSMEYLPSQEAKEGISAAIRKLQLQAEQLLKEGESEAAELIFQVADESGVSDIYKETLAQAEKSFLSGDLEKAFSVATTLTLAPRNIRIDAAIITAKVLAAEGQTAEATKLLEKAALEHGVKERLLLYRAAANISAIDIVNPDAVIEFLSDSFDCNNYDEDTDSALISLYEIKDNPLKLAEHLAKPIPVFDQERIRKAAALFTFAGKDERAENILQILYRETDAIEDLFLLADTLKKQGKYELLIDMLEERRNEDTRVDEMLRCVLADYSGILQKQSMFADDISSPSSLERSASPTNSQISADVDAVLPALADDEDIFEEKLSLAFSRLRKK